MRRDIQEYIDDLAAKRDKAALAKKPQMWAYHQTMIDVLTLAFERVRAKENARDICNTISRNAIMLCPVITDPRFLADLWAAGVHARALLPRLGGWPSRPTLAWFRKRAGIAPKDCDRSRAYYAYYN